MRLLVTRTQPDAGRQAELLGALGHEAVLSPLLEVEFLNPRPLPLSDARGLVVTSRNALRALVQMDDFSAALGLPLFATGSATARLAAGLGFADVHEGAGTAKELVPLIVSLCQPGDGPLVHLAGERLAWDLKGALEDEGFTVRQPVLYRTVPVERLSQDARKALESDALDGVILMSPASAAAYADLVRAHGLERAAARLTCFCLSDNVANELEGVETARVEVAAKPAQEDLLALIMRDAAN